MGTADLDPVYPFDQSHPVGQPPFINENKGLTESPPGALAVKAQSPINFTSTGALALEPVYVTLTSNQTVQGNKTFTGNVEVDEPQNDQDAANKQYVDRQISEFSKSKTLWTGVQANSNQTNYADTMFVYCSLTKVGSMVLGQIALSGVAGQWQNIGPNTGPFYLNIICNMQGQFVNVGTYFPMGMKVGSTMDSSVAYNALRWCPNRFMYGGVSKQSLEIFPINLNLTSTTPTSQTMRLIVTFNDQQTASQGLSIRFQYVKDSITQTVPFKTNMVTFMYYADEP